MLNFEEFNDYVLEHIGEKLPKELKEANIALQTIVKNNGVILTGLTVKEKDSSVAPNVYLNGFFEKYQEGASLDSLVAEIANISAKSQTNEFANIADAYKNFDFVKERVVMMLVNAESNAQMLETTPHTLHEDLAIIYKVMLESKDGGMASIRITDKHLKLWEVSVEELHELAMENSKRLLPVKCQTMNELMMGMFGADGMPEEIRELMLASIPLEQQMFIISNERDTCGGGICNYLRKYIRRTF